MLKPIVIGAPDGASAGLAAEAASVIAAAATITPMSFRNMFLPPDPVLTMHHFEIAVDAPGSQAAIWNCIRLLLLSPSAANQQQNLSWGLRRQWSGQPSERRVARRGGFGESASAIGISSIQLQSSWSRNAEHYAMRIRQF